MATRLYSTKIAIELSPTYSPEIVITVDGDILYTGIIEAPLTLIKTYNFSKGKHSLKVIHRNKNPNDPTTAVAIKNIAFNGISRNKFVWLGVYHPKYPEPWATQMRNQGYILDPSLSACDHLGWNGEWVLEFTTPIFTWIHRVENLGWIYN